MELKQIDMQKVTGGALTSAWLNAISKGIATLYELGRNTGSALRRLISGSYCPIN